MDEKKNRLSDPPRLTPTHRVVPAPLEDQKHQIRPGSALAVIGVFVEAIRLRFRPVDGVVFDWPFDDDIKKTKIAIESAFSEEAEHRNKKPAIYVDRDEQVIGRTVIGDRAGQVLTSGLEAFWALETTPILIECIAAKRGESAIIADLVGVFLQASSDLIQSAFGFHEMTPVTRGRTQPSMRDKGYHTTPVTFTVQYNFRWTTKPSEPLIQEIVAKVQNSGADSAMQFFESVALFGRFEP